MEQKSITDLVFVCLSVCMCDRPGERTMTDVQYVAELLRSVATLRDMPHQLILELASCAYLEDLEEGVTRESPPARTIYTPFSDQLWIIHAWNSVKVQTISTDHTPDHVLTAAEMPRRQKCLHYFWTACAATWVGRKRCTLIRHW